MKSTSKNSYIFKGVATALITPFREGKIDYPALFNIIENQISSNIPALVLCGTTGEAATLSERERESIICAAVERIDARVPLIVGVGTNDTATSIKNTRFASSHGADALLVVTPYYNKGTKGGVVEHYKRIASETELPIIVYNVPSRTGMDISISQMSQLASEKNIVAIKEASPSIEKAELFLRAFGDRYALYSGNDSHILPTIAIGGLGVISVVSNILPKETNAICNLFFTGKTEESRKMQLRLLKLINLLFEDTNPAPIKYAAHLLDMCQNELRLPLSPIEDELKTKIKEELFSIIKS